MKAKYNIEQMNYLDIILTQMSMSRLKICRRHCNIAEVLAGMTA